MPETILTVVGGDNALLEPGRALDRLSAAKFIKPNLSVYGKRVVTDARVYPPATATYQTKARRGKSYGTRGKLGAILKGLTAQGSQTKTATTRYQRTYNLQRQWHRSLRGVPGAGALTEEIKNLATYSGWVMGPKQPYTWRFGWRRLRAIMLDLMDDWIAEMEHKAYNLWIRKV